MPHEPAVFTSQDYDDAEDSFGGMSLYHAGGMASVPITTVIRKGAFGPSAFHNWLPIQGNGSEITPRLVVRKPNVIAIKWEGTPFETNELSAGWMTAPPTPSSIQENPNPQKLTAMANITRENTKIEKPVTMLNRSLVLSTIHPPKIPVATIATP